VETGTPGHGHADTNRQVVVNIWLVVQENHLEKYDFISWDDDIPNMEKKQCSKPPIRL